MKKSFIYILLILSLVTSSCKNDEFFELSRAPEFPWQSVSEYEKSAIGAYNLALREWNNSIFGADMCMDFTLSENARFVVGSVHGFPDQVVNGRIYSQSNWKIDNSFQRCYQTIAACNSALEFYEANNGVPFPNATEIDKKDNVNRIAGELYFLRAYAHFFLIRYYHPPYNPNGDNDFTALPYRPKLATSMEEALNPEFATTEQFYQSILSDFGKAKELLPESYSSTMNKAYQYGRANKYAAAIMLARVYMVMGQLDKAESEYSFVIDSQKYSLEVEPINNFNRATENYTDSNSEIIWEFFQSSPNAGDLAIGDFSHYNKCSMFRSNGDKHNPLFTPIENFASTGGRGNNWSMMGWGQYSISHKALKRIGWMNEDCSLGDAAKKDKRFQQIYYYFLQYKADADPELGEDTLYLTPSYCAQETKPTIWCDKAYRGSNSMLQNFPIIRYPEALIHRAAIRLNRGDKPGAASDLNIVRKRAWGDSSVPYESSDQYLTAANITEQIIIDEHIKELTGEGLWTIFQIAFRRTIGEADIPNPAPAINPPYSEMYWPIPPSELMFYNK